jgi:hypothetical protein
MNYSVCIYIYIVGPSPIFQFLDLLFIESSDGGSARREAATCT